MLGGVIGSDSRHVVESDPANVRAAEVDGDKEQQKYDRDDQSKLDEALPAGASCLCRVAEG